MKTKKSNVNNVKNIENTVVTNDIENTVVVESFENSPEKTKKTIIRDGKCKKIVEFITPLIDEGKFTQKELAKIAIESLPEQCPLTITTLLCDCKNPKYNKFAKLVKKTENGTLTFA